MDRKSLIVVVVCIVLMLLWTQLVDKIFPRPPRPSGTNTVATTTNLATATNLAEALAPATTNAVAMTNPPAATNLIPAAWAQAKEETLELTTEDAIYTFTSFGGGLKEIPLKNYPEIVTRRRQGSATNRLATLNDNAPLAVLTALGADAVQGDGLFQLSRLRDGRGVRAEKSLPDGLNIVKEFEVGSNYVLTANIRFENKSASSLTIPAIEWVTGTATPMSPLDPGMYVGLDWHNGVKAQYVSESYFANASLSGCVSGRQQRRTEYRMGASNVFWAAVENQFFALAVAPREPALEIVSRRILLPKPTAEDIAANPKVVREPHGYQTSLLMPAQTILAGGSFTQAFMVYAGPKEYKTLSSLSLASGKDLDAVMGLDRSIAGRFGGFFAKLLLLSMNGLHALLGLGYGWIILLITFIIKLLFWPLTQASTRSMKRMAELGPQMKAIQAKYKDDPRKQSQKTMEFMKENKVNPMGGCLPMLLQFPVFIGFFTMIQCAIELRGASFLWAFDLSKPDTVFHIPGLGFIPFLGVEGMGFPVNPLSLIMAVTMWYQARMTPLSPGMDPAQQKMMKYMPLMFVVMLYNYSAALTLYWTTQNLLTILQTKITRAKERPKPTPPRAKPGKKN